MSLYRPPDMTADGKLLDSRPLRWHLRTPTGITRGGLRPALQDTSREGNSVLEIAQAQQLAAGIRPAALDPMPPPSGAEEFNRGYEGIG